MKNIIGKIIIVAIMATMVMAMCGFTYETEEVPVSLIDELIDEGFTRDEYDTNIWRYEENSYDHDDGWTYLFAWFDTDENIGTATEIEYDTNRNVRYVASNTFRWNNIYEEIEVLGEYDYEKD